MKPTPVQPAARPLAAVLQEAGRELRAEHPPADLQARIHAALPARGRPPGAATPRRWSPGLQFAGAGSLAGLALVSMLVFLRPLPLPTAVYDEGVQGGFVPVLPAERWPRDSTPAWLVSTELQSERLAALGLPYDPSRAGESVRAELLLHASGEVLAVRLLN